MRFAGNFFSEWQGGSHHTLLAAFVACAVGATACAAVVLSLVSSPTTQPAVSSNSPRAIVRNAGAFEPTQSAQDHPLAETPSRPAAVAPGPGEPARQAQENHEADAHGQESRKHGRVVIRSREPYWRRPFAHAFSQSPRFSSW
jgi:hypothetical protein